jgi:hypothetical protein
MQPDFVLIPFGPLPPDLLDNVPTMPLVCELVDRYGAEGVLQYFGMSVEQLLTTARELDGDPASESFAADLLAAADELEALAD